MLILALTTVFARAQTEEPDAQYLRIYNVITEADLLTTNGKTNAAFLKYQDAQKALLGFRRTNLTWNVKMVSYRLNYVSNRLAQLSRPVPVGSAPAPVTATTMRNAAASAAQAPAAVSSVQVRLLNSGAEPRRALRIQAKPGEKQSVDMTMRMTMTMEMPGIPSQPMAMPAVKMPFEVTIQNVAANGDVTYQSVMGEPSIEEEPGTLPQVAAAMKASLNSVEGMVTTGVISERGLNKGLEVKLPPGADAQARQSLSQLKEAMSSAATPLPEEAVGVGARWEVRQPLRSQGMMIDQTITYELVSLEANRFSAKCTIVQTAGSQKISSPAMPVANVDLVSMKGSGTGDLHFDLDRIMAAQATFDSQTEMVMEMAMGNQKQAMNMKMGIVMQLETK